MAAYRVIDFLFCSCMGITACIPLYKGLVHAPDARGVALLTREDPTTHAPIEPDQYLALVRESAGIYPELVQDIARATAAAVMARIAREEWHENPVLVTVEGCSQRVGDKVLTGAAITQAIWKNVVPRELIAGIPMRIAHTSRCTVEEIRAMLALEPGASQVYGVTHDYHRARTRRMLSEEGVRYQHVYTPEDVVRDHMRTSHPPLLFAQDLMTAAAMPESVLATERRNEHAYACLHAVSRLGEQVTRGRWNLEVTLAHALRRNGHTAAACQPGTPG